MKKLVLLTLLAAAVVFSAVAQNRSIQFEQAKEWKKVLKKAKKEKKLVFVDCYTSWCGPCKMLASQVFTQDAVADYFNEHFVCAKYDMEKDADGVKLKSSFAINAFPTLVFFDPVAQQVVHKMVGAGTADWLLAGAKNARDPQNNLNGLTKRYNDGERGAGFLSKYLDALASAYMTEEQGKVAVEYLNSLSVDQLATKENWVLIKKNINDPLSKPLREVMANREKFYTVADKDVVNYKLETAINGAVAQLAGWRPAMDGNFDENRNTEMVNYLMTIDFPAAPAALAQLYTAAYIRKGDFRGLLDKMKEVMSYNMFRNGGAQAYFQSNIEALTLCEDKALVEEGIKWIDQQCQRTPDYFTKANLMNSKARLQKKIGDTIGAEKSKMQEEKYNAEGEKKSGGRVMRAIRMG